MRSNLSRVHVQSQPGHGTKYCCLLYAVVSHHMTAIRLDLLDATGNRTPHKVGRSVARASNLQCDDTGGAFTTFCVGTALRH